MCGASFSLLAETPLPQAIRQILTAGLHGRGDLHISDDSTRVMASLVAVPLTLLHPCLPLILPDRPDIEPGLLDEM